MDNVIKDKIREKFNKLLLIYKKNVEDALSIPLKNIAEKSDQLILTKNQFYIKNQLISLLLSNIKVELSRNYINTILKPFMLKCINIDDTCKIEKYFVKMITKLQNAKLKKINIIKPAVAHVLLNEPIKIIDLELFTNPIEYLSNKFTIANRQFNESFFNNIDGFNKGLPQVGVLAEVEAIDEDDAEHQFIKLSQEAIGLLKLFNPSYEVYFTTQKPLAYFSSYYLINGVLSGKEMVDYNFNRIHITNEFYAYLKTYCLDWLNNWRQCKDIKKSLKIKAALYWYSYAIDEKNLTNKFIFMVTVLECVLKNDNEKSEITALIADRTSSLLCTNITERTRVKERIKKIYGKRSKIVHTGLTLRIKDGLLVDEIHYYVREVLLKALKELSDPNSSFKMFIKAINNKKFEGK
ncbi:MAG: hypothetical protein KBD37_01135 [Burkholderiales bacterium]|nr:hypothetical protein [Burkholderiales bacterium]